MHYLSHLVLNHQLENNWLIERCYMLRSLLSGRSHDAILNNFDPRSFNIEALSTSNGVEME